MVDLCSGPHLPNTGFLKAVGVTNCSRAFWRADVNREPLQRVYAITFPDKAQLKDYQHREQQNGGGRMGAGAAADGWQLQQG
jgi:threonyl-tRNA synthetase